MVAATLAVCLGAVAAIALLVQGTGGHPRGTADCTPLVRLDGVVYRQHSYLDYRPTRSAGTAERSDCDDLGRDAKGSQFPEHPQHVTAWSLRDEQTDDVIGIQETDELLAVYARVGTPENQIEKTVDRLRRTGPSTGR